MTKKSRFIEKLTSLSDAEKEKVITFFNKYPVYENQIDWNNTMLLYQDFEKVFLLAENSRSRIKQRAKDNPELLFKGYNCRIVHRNKAFMIVMPLDWECAVYMNSFNCGGEGAKWRIGDKKNFEHWNMSIEYGSVFYLVYFFIKHSLYGRKLMLEYKSSCDYLSLYRQDGNELLSIYTVFENICRKDIASLNKIAFPRIREYEECSFESLFAMLEDKDRCFFDYNVLEICSLIIKNGNEENLKRLYIYFNSIYKSYREKCLKGTYTSSCMQTIKENVLNGFVESEEIWWNVNKSFSFEEFTGKIFNAVEQIFDLVIYDKIFDDFLNNFIKDAFDYDTVSWTDEYDTISEEVFNNIIVKYIGMYITEFYGRINKRRSLGSIEICFKYVWRETQHYKRINECVT